jgi:hypothetical protein
MISVREQLKEFYGQKPFPTKFMYFVTRLDFHKPTAEPQVGEDGRVRENENTASEKQDGIDGLISVYVAICGNGSVMVPMSVFPPIESWHWERKKPVKLRHAHSVHRSKKNDPQDALQFFSVVGFLLSSICLLRRAKNYVNIYRHGRSFTMKKPSLVINLCFFLMRILTSFDQMNFWKE